MYWKFCRASIWTEHFDSSLGGRLSPPFTWLNLWWVMVREAARFARWRGWWFKKAQQVRHSEINPKTKIFRKIILYVPLLIYIDTILKQTSAFNINVKDRSASSPTLLEAFRFRSLNAPNQVQEEEEEEQEEESGPCREDRATLMQRTNHARLMVRLVQRALTDEGEGGGGGGGGGAYC